MRGMCVGISSIDFTASEYLYTHAITAVYSWGQKSVSKQMHLCALQHKLASPTAITS